MTDSKGSCCKGRPRSAKSTAAILDATLRLLEDRPLRDTTIEAIAQEAGVGKATIYKWWPSKAHLALEAFLSRTERDVSIPDTGSARTDFEEQLQSLQQFYQSKIGRLFCQFLAEGQIDPEFAAHFRDSFLSSRRKAVGVILERGMARGELAADLDRELALDLLYGPMFYRLLAGHAPVNGGEMAKVVAAVFDGISIRQE